MSRADNFFAHPEGLSSFLGSAINEPRGGRLANNNTFRRYATTIRTTIMLNGNQDSDAKKIIYEVGRHHGTIAAALAPAAAGTVRFYGGHANSATLSEEVRGLVKKYSNFSGIWRQSDLSGVVERLARGIATWSLFENVNSHSLAAGQPIHLTSLDVLTTPVEADRASVFIPRIVDGQVAPNVFAILVAAIAGEGGRVVTDRLAVDAGTNASIVPTVDTHCFPRACVDALRLLGANMAESGAGDLFALAVTRGIHRTLSVVGHTDEGGLTRSVLRRGAYAQPYGVIHPGLPPYVCIPALSSVSAAAVAGWCDAIALITAGAVAHCDPGIVRKNEWFPSVFTATDGVALASPGANQAPTAAGVINIRNAICEDSPRFCSSYLGALTKVFGFTENSHIGELLLGEMFNDLPNSERHLQYTNVAPYF